MAQLSPAALDTITTRFLLLFLFLLTIPLGVLIVFTVSMLASHLESSTQNQISLSQNLFREAMGNTRDNLKLLSAQMRELPADGCLKNHHLLCLSIAPGQERMWLSTDGQTRFSDFRVQNRDLEGSYTQNMEGKDFLAQISRRLFLVQKDDRWLNQGIERFYAVPIDNALLNRIYQRQNSLQTEIWILDEENRRDPAAPASLLAQSPSKLNPKQARALLAALPSNSSDGKGGFVLELPQGAYQIAQEALYSLDSRKIARVVHILPLAQNRLLLNNYYVGLYVIVVASLIFSVLLAMAAGRTITQPLLKLVNQVNMLSRENVMKEGDKAPVSGVQEIRQLGEAFNRMIVRLRQEHKMKDEFVATLTHDLKVPLLAEKQTLAYFLSETYGPLSEEQAEILAILKASNRSCLSLVNGLLEVYRYDSGEVSLVLEPINITNLMSHVIGELNSLAQERSISLTLKCDIKSAEDAVVYADSLEIKRVLHNLISNAITNTPVHGKIECRITDATCYGHETVYKVSSFQHTTLKYPVKLVDKVLITIQDSGVGFSNDDLSHLFKQFAASKGRNPMSIGLGLYNCYQVLQAHHNALWLESTEGEGSAVSFTLARNKQAAQDRRVYRDRRKRS